MSDKIKIECIIKASPDLVWLYWTEPQYITQWNFANDDWICPVATNDLHTEGSFCYRMEAKNGEMGFDFKGIYSEVIQGNKITYQLEDDREVEVYFEKEGENTRLIEIFDPENENPVEMQEAGWQSILDNFKHFVESKNA